jgi:hypothetical protein
VDDLGRLARGGALDSAFPAESAEDEWSSFGAMIGKWDGFPEDSPRLIPCITIIVVRDDGGR